MSEIDDAARLESERSAYEAAQAVEYGTYRATQNILHEGVLAFTEGSPVPVSSVEAHGYLTDGLVEPVHHDPAPAEAVTKNKPADPPAPADDKKKD